MKCQHCGNPMFTADTSCRVCGVAVSPMAEPAAATAVDPEADQADMDEPRSTQVAVASVPPSARPDVRNVPVPTQPESNESALLGDVLRELQAIRGAVAALSAVERAPRVAAPLPNTERVEALSSELRPYEPGLFEALVDWRLRKFVSRHVLAVLYTLLFWISIVATPVAAYFGFEVLRGTCVLAGTSGTPDVCSGIAPVYAWAAIPVSVLAWLVVVVVLRVIFERAAAYVVIAQNTGPLYER